MKIAVVGGGLAGLAAALECAEGGVEVTLYEARPRLGGATFSIERNGYWLDNGQHVTLRCCTEYLAFLRRIGAEQQLDLQPRLRIPVLSEGGRAFITRTSLPAPLHLVASLLRYSHLNLRERIGAGRVATALRKLDPDDPALDEQTFGSWLRAHGQSKRAIANLWNLIALPTLNLDADDASLALAAKVFRTGLLDSADAADVGVPSVPLQQLHAEHAARALERLGARVQTGARVQSIGELAADAVIVAVPHDAAARLGVIDANRAEALGVSPIVNVHLHFDRRVLDEPFAAAVGSPVQWLFDRTESSGIGEGQLVSISVSGADRELEESQDELRTRYVPAVERLLPRARDAQLLDFFVTREPRATFRGVPGTRRLRPQVTDCYKEGSRVFLAGAWTDTGWPATMEGAVRSGLAAARAALSSPVRRQELVA